jgi:HSP20 family protein
MAIIPWEPLKDIERFFEEDWDFLPLLPIKGLKVPEADIYETDKDLIIEMPLAGVKPEDVEISLQDNVLTVKGEMKEEKEEKERNYYRKEIKRGKFERSIK